MSIESNKIMNLADGKVLYDDLRGRVEAKYTKPVAGIPATDLEDGAIPDPTELIDDTAGSGDTDVTWSADKSQTEVDSVVTISDTQPQQSGNKIWIEEDAEEVYTIPTTAEMTAGLAAKVNKPSSDGTSGQLLRTNGDGSTYWDNDASATDIANAVTDWLDENVSSGQTLVVDSSLTVSGAAADAKKAGDEISDLKNEIDETIEHEVQYGKNRNNIDAVEDGYLSSNGDLIVYGNWKTTDYCYVEGFSDIIASVDGTPQTMFYLCTYDADKTFIEQVWTTGSHTAQLDSDVAYVRYSINGVSSEHTYQLESGTTITAYEAFSYSGKYVVKTDTTLTNNNLPANAKSVGDKINPIETKIGNTSMGTTATTITGAIAEHSEEIAGFSDSAKAMPQIIDKFDQAETVLPMGDFANGYIDNNGDVVTTGYGSYKYAAITIDASMIGATILVSGSAWYAIKPYVFVGSTSIVVPSVEDPGSTVVQYTDLEFVPSEAGTLYINRYGSQIGSASLVSVGALKKTAMPSDVMDVLNYYPSYTEKTITRINGKLLNASTGEITDASSHQNWCISDYIDISDAVDVKVSTEMFYGYALYVFYDQNKGYLSGKASGSSGTPTLVYLDKAEVPENAKYIVIGFLGNDVMTEPYLFANTTPKSIDPSQKYNGKKWACVGDSLTANNDKTSYHYFDYISDETGITPINMGVSGTGYANGQNSNNAFYQRILNIDTSADVITLFGSFNDLSASLSLGEYTDTGTTTIAGCINTTLDNLYSVIPLANVAIVSPTPWNNSHPGESGTYSDYVNLLKKIAEYRSIPFLNLWNESGLRPWDATFKQLAYSNDGGNGVHPNAVGHRIIAPRFLKLLEGMIL